jgi:carbon-monoxide dehydrogenase large subunit
VLVGASPKRKEDGRFVAGQGRYLDDVRVAGLLHLALVRSPHAHARVRGIDATAARATAGVLVVLTLDDLPELVAATVPPLVPEPQGRVYVHPVLAGARVRHVGEAVAVVVATDPYAAADGVERVAVTYEPLPAAVSAASAAAPGAPRVNDTWPDNLASITASAKGRPAGSWPPRMRPIKQGAGSRCGPPPRCRSRCAAPSPRCSGWPRSASA